MTISDFEDYFKRLELPEHYSDFHRDELENRLLKYCSRRNHAAAIRRRVLIAGLGLLVLAFPLGILGRKYSEEIGRHLSLTSFRVLTRLHKLTVSTGEWTMRAACDYFLLEVDKDTMVVTKTGSGLIMTLNVTDTFHGKPMSVVYQIESLRRQGRGKTLLGSRGGNGILANVYRYALSNGNRVWVSEAEASEIDKLRGNNAARIMGLRTSGKSTGSPPAVLPSVSRSP